MLNPVLINGWIDGFSAGTTNPQHVFSLSGNQRKEWVIKGYISQTHAITEILAAQMAISIGLDVPSHSPVFLPEDVIEDTPELKEAGYVSGYHVGVEYQQGYDLELILESDAIERQVLSRLDMGIAAGQAVGLVVADTALCNSDHYPGSGNIPVTVSGNVGNIYFAETAEGYAMRAIDFGASMNFSQWGQNSGGDWPSEVFGTVKYFFLRRWLAPNTVGIQERLGEFQARLLALDLPLVVQEVVATLPQEWRVSNPSVAAGLPQGNLSQADWTDLVRRLERHRSLVPATISAKYDEVGRRMAGVKKR